MMLPETAGPTCSREPSAPGDASLADQPADEGQPPSHALHRLFHNEAVLLARAGAVDEAIGREEVALALDASSVESLVVMGKLYAQKAKYGRAIQCWEAALGLDPRNDRARAGIKRARALQTRRRLFPKVGGVAPLGAIAAFAVVVLTLALVGRWPSYGGVPAPVVSQPEDVAVSEADTPLPGMAAAEAQPIHSDRDVESDATASSTQKDVVSPVDTPFSVSPVTRSPFFLQAASPEPAPPALEEPAAPGDEEIRERMVRRGDTLLKIAAEDYGDTEAWRSIWEANQSELSDPNVIYPGQVLQMPQ